jgi:hypothetical protein
MLSDKGSKAPNSLVPGFWIFLLFTTAKNSQQHQKQVDKIQI